MEVGSSTVFEIPVLDMESPPQPTPRPPRERDQQAEPSFVGTIPSCEDIPPRPEGQKPTRPRRIEGMYPSCECFPETKQRPAPGDVAKIVAPPQPPCTCYEMAEPREPGPAAGYLGMGYPPPGFGSPAYRSTPGYLVPEQLPPYTVLDEGSWPVLAGANGSPVMANRFLITGEDNFSVEVTDYGARVMAVRMPDKNGDVVNVLLGFDDVQEYARWKQVAQWGGVQGRLADCVRGPRPGLRDFGVYCNLTENDEDEFHHRLGGFVGFDRVMWQAEKREHGVVLTYMSRAGEEGYPGTVLATAEYSVQPPNRLVIRLDAVCSAPTPLALAVTLPFNLAGHCSGKEGLMGHALMLHSDHVLHFNKKKFATGELRPVRCTPLDFRVPRRLRQMFGVKPAGYNHYMWCPRDAGEEGLNLMARLYHPGTRRQLEVRSDQPVLWLSTSLGLPPPPPPEPAPEVLEDVQQLLDEALMPVKAAEAAAPAAAAAAEPTAEEIVTDILFTARAGAGDTPSLSDEESGDYEEELEGEGEGSEEGGGGEGTRVRRGKSKTKKKGEEEEEKAKEPTEAEMVVADLLAGLMEEVRTPPPEVYGHEKCRYYDQFGIVLRPQHSPLRADRDDMQRLLLRPGQRYTHTVELRFSVRPMSLYRERARRYRNLARLREGPYATSSEEFIDKCSEHGSLHTLDESTQDLWDTCSQRGSDPGDAASEASL